MDRDEERIALFLDYENLALGARDHLGGMEFNFRPIGDALAERGRVVVRRAYADWSYFDEDRRMLARSQVELIEIPQRVGGSRKNAADIKMAVDAIELAFERDYIGTFVICTGDSDFTPLVHKLRELNKKVIGVGVQNSTSALLPPACDEFLFYESLEGVDAPVEPARQRGRGARRTAGKARPETPVDADVPEEPESVDDETRTVEHLAVLIAQTVVGMQKSASGPVAASMLKRALLRKDPTFSEADYGFRAFGEMLAHLGERSVIELVEGPAPGDPGVTLPEHVGGESEAFALLRSVVEQDGRRGVVILSGLKSQVRKIRPDFTEKKFGYRSFLQFVRAAEREGFVDLAWNDAADGYVLTASKS